jgi:hypothetical protein
LFLVFSDFTELSDGIALAVELAFEARHSFIQYDDVAAGSTSANQEKQDACDDPFRFHAEIRFPGIGCVPGDECGQL